MIKRIPEQQLILSEEEQEKMAWNEWRFHSHKWKEVHKGYYTCEYCGLPFTNLMAIDDSVKLCLKNPFIMELKKLKK